MQKLEVSLQKIYQTKSSLANCMEWSGGGVYKVEESVRSFGTLVPNHHGLQEAM